MTKTAKTYRIVTAAIKEHGHPRDWTMGEARAMWAACPDKTLFDGFEDFMCAIIVRARGPF